MGDHEAVIVLDTHALLWVLEDSRMLGRRAALIANRALTADRLWTSALSFWEVSLLAQRDRVRLAAGADQFRGRVQDLGIREAAVTGEIALAAARLSTSIKDPADCFIAATAIVSHARLMTADARLLAADVVDTVDARR